MKAQIRITAQPPTATSYVIYLPEGDKDIDFLSIFSATHALIKAQDELINHLYLCLERGYNVEAFDSVRQSLQRAVIYRKEKYKQAIHGQYE